MQNIFKYIFNKDCVIVYVMKQHFTDKLFINKLNTEEYKHI